MNGKQRTSGLNRSESSSQVDLNDQLLKAVYNNDLNKVQELLKSGADINASRRVEEGDYINYTPLILAAARGYVELSEALLQTPGVDINKEDDYNCTALHKASNLQHAQIVKLLLGKEKINVNVKDKYGSTPLIVAASSGNEEAVEKLLQKPGILVNAKNNSGQTALHKSVANGHLEVVKRLVNVGGILVNETDNVHNHTPLHLAADPDLNKIAKLYHVNFLEVLLSHPDINLNAKDKYGQTALITSAYHGNLRAVVMLLKAGINANEKTDQGLTAVHWAAKGGHTSVVEAIVNHLKHVGASGFNSGNKSRQVGNLTQRLENVAISGQHQISSSSVNGANDQLLLAAANGDLGKIKELLKSPGIDVNFTDRYTKNTPLHLASEKGHLEVVQILLEQAGIEVNMKNNDNTRLACPIYSSDDLERNKLDIGKTALHLAVIGKHLGVVKALVNDSRSDVNTKDKYGVSPLDVAVRDNNIEMVETLLSHQYIDVNIPNAANDYFTALHSAADHGYTEIAKMLLNHPNINVNLKDKYYVCTPLHLAVEGNRIEIVEAILSHPKVDVIAKAKYDETPLHKAAEKGYLEIVERLLSANANVNAKDICGKTPLDLAQAQKHLSTVYVLQNF